MAEETGSGKIRVNQRPQTKNFLQPRTLSVRIGAGLVAVTLGLSGLIGSYPHARKAIYHNRHSEITQTDRELAYNLRLSMSEYEILNKVHGVLVEKGVTHKGHAITKEELMQVIRYCPVGSPVNIPLTNLYSTNQRMQDLNKLYKAGKLENPNKELGVPEIPEEHLEAAERYRMDKKEIRNISAKLRNEEFFSYKELYNLLHVLQTEVNSEHATITTRDLEHLQYKADTRTPIDEFNRIRQRVDDLKADPMMWYDWKSELRNETNEKLRNPNQKPISQLLKEGAIAKTGYGRENKPGFTQQPRNSLQSRQNTTHKRM